MAFDALLTADRLAQLSRLVSPEQAAAGVFAGLPGSSWAPAVSDDASSVNLDGTWQSLAAEVAAMLRAWLQAKPDGRERPTVAPPRPTDTRRRLLWRTPPPERLELEFRPIDCRTFRRVGDPPMEWTQPLRPRRRNGPGRSAQAG